jgi:hypothetical protein
MIDPAPHVNPTQSQPLPGPLIPTGSHIQCSARPPKAFARNAKIHSTTKLKDSSGAHQQSVAIQLEHDTVLSSGTTAASPNSKLRQRRYADAFSLPKNTGNFSNGPKQRIPAFTHSDLTRNLTIDGPPIISIGPHTDAVLDRFKMGDEVILKLRQLISTVCSSRWEAVLISPKWDLTFEQATNITKALNADLQGQKLDVNITV